MYFSSRVYVLYSNIGQKDMELNAYNKAYQSEMQPVSLKRVVDAYPSCDFISASPADLSLPPLFNANKGTHSFLFITLGRK